MKRKLSKWDRNLWGVLFITPRSEPLMIGSVWRKPIDFKHYPDEPTRPLIFNSRASARKWCAEQNEEYKKRSDFVGQWRMHVIKVREVVSELPRKKR